MTSQMMKDLTHQYIMGTYGRFPVAIDHGQGATLYDPEGNAYIDFTSGIGVTALGYGHQPWVDAITDQAKKLVHTSNLFYTEPPGQAGGAPLQAHRRELRLLCQRRRRGQRGHDQAGPEVQL